MITKLQKSSLKEVLAKAEHELQDITLRAERLKEFIASTRKLMGKALPGEAIHNSGASLFPIRRRRSNVIAEHVAEVLREAGDSLHVQAIVKRLEAKGHRVTAANPLATVAIALKRRPTEFEKVGPNIFALIKKEGEASKT